MMFYCLQCIEHIVFLTGHLRAGDTTGKLILIATAWEQLLTGTIEHILSKDGQTVHSYLEESWVNNSMEFLNQANVKVKIHSSWRVEPSRENDSNLVDEIGKGEDTNTKNLLNKCRIYLKVKTMSDIKTCCSKAIDPRSWQAKEHTSQD